MQDGQRILLTTPSVLVGFRVEVYRAEGTTQWYTAVIVGYNESTKVREKPRRPDNKYYPGARLPLSRWRLCPAALLSNPAYRKRPISSSIERRS